MVKYGRFNTAPKLENFVYVSYKFSLLTNFEYSVSLILKIKFVKGLKTFKVLRL